MTSARILRDCKVYKLETFRTILLHSKSKMLCHVCVDSQRMFGRKPEKVGTAITSMVDAAWTIQAMILNQWYDGNYNTLRKGMDFRLQFISS